MEIGNIATKYFQKLFHSSNPNLRDIRDVVDCSEIELAVKSLSPNKAPGRDGANASYYQGYWDIG